MIVAVTRHERALKRYFILIFIPTYFARSSKPSLEIPVIENVEKYHHCENAS